MTPQTEPQPNRANLSVIVPVYNDARNLTACLAALAASQNSEFEVIVVDDGSTEPIEPIVARHRFRYLRLDGPNGPAYARNCGAELATHPYLVFIDADVCVHTDTLQWIIGSLLASEEVAAVVGCYDETPAQSNFFSQYKNLFHHYIHQRSAGEIHTFWSGCGAIKKELFLAFGGFDHQRYRRPAIEDIELGTWITASGHRIVLNRQIQVTHLKRWSFFSLLKSDIFDRGIPWTRLMLRAGAVANTLNLQPAQRLSVALVYLLIGLILAAFGLPQLWVAVCAMAIILVIVNYDCYRFFLRRKGLGFSLRVLPLHWLYFVYCGVCVVTGTILYLLKDGAASQHPHPRV